ncbi:hypothetical protein C8P66_14812 [Humitalea rosea]|uniref:Uncharacterized protein n=1 Tax=Humitalea rosea TaxID=990373 RepID=A0A2W7HW00_9PROT|nr:hypothetical protein [Humitalea rosea]PZW37002.1 hypothetical protein C8P66_14812 [Humitalea rosea]
MAFDPTALVALTTTEVFTLWHYTTHDTRAATLAPGYFSAAAARLHAGHIILVIAVDSISMLPVRSAGATGNGLVLDAANAPLVATAAATPSYAFGFAGNAVARSLALGTLPAAMTQGRQVTVTATTTGPVTSLAFSIRNAAGTAVAGPVTVAPVSGAASAVLILPDPGSGFRLRAEAPDDSAVVAVSPPFSITVPYSLLIGDADRMLLEQGGALLLEP